MKTFNERSGMFNNCLVHEFVEFIVVHALALVHEFINVHEQPMFMNKVRVHAQNKLLHKVSFVIQEYL